MQESRCAARGLVLLGCGKMGSAMLAGWLARGLPAASVWVIDPHPSEWLVAQGVHLNVKLPANPAVVLVAVKPQMMADALPSLQAMGNGETVFVSVAAGTTIAYFEQTLGIETPVVRAMPNTPAAISQGITAIVANAKAGEAGLSEAEALLRFHMIETMAAAGVAQGLPGALAMQLAKATVAGAGALALQADEDPAQLRVNVTSPNGTTQAALEVLMDEKDGFPALLKRAVKAATDRSKELARG
jgi:pyrroline-5-carboxylate reductase